MVFSGLSPLVVEEVAEQSGVIRVRARTPGGSVPCPGCGWAASGCMPITSGRWPMFRSTRRVSVVVRVRRLLCPTQKCVRRSFREQVPGVLERYQRRTPRLARWIAAVVRELAGRAGARVLCALAMGISRHTAVRVLLCLPLPVVRVPRVLGVDDLALRRRHRYATILIDAETRQRVDVLPERGASALEPWRRTVSARRRPDRRSARASAPRPPSSACSRSTTFWIAASGCSNAHGGSISP
jgi:transposase